MLISTLAVVITLLLMTTVFYRILQSQIIEDLKIYANVLAQGDILESLQYNPGDLSKDNMRITVIGADSATVTLP